MVKIQNDMCGENSTTLLQIFCNRLRVFEHSVLRKMFGPMKYRVTKEWKRLHKEELYDLYSCKYYSDDQIKKNKMGGACETYGGHARCIQNFGGET
jgi:hypothetical protein